MQAHRRDIVRHALVQKIVEAYERLKRPDAMMKRISLISRGRGAGRERSDEA